MALVLYGTYADPLDVLSFTAFAQHLSEVQRG